MSDILKDLEAKASARLGEACGTNPHGVTLRTDTGHAETVTPCGVVRCDVITTDKQTAKRRHTRATFKLDGRVIKRADLAALLARRPEVERDSTPVLLLVGLATWSDVETRERVRLSEHGRERLRRLRLRRDWTRGALVNRAPSQLSQGYNVREAMRYSVTAADRLACLLSQLPHVARSGVNFTTFIPQRTPGALCLQMRAVRDGSTLITQSAPTLRELWRVCFRYSRRYLNR